MAARIGGGEMALPRLIHPVLVTFERFEPDDMVMDADAREPVHGLRNVSGTVVIPCQVKLDELRDPAPNVGGTVEESKGYFLARSVDLDTILGVNVRLKRGDRVVQYASMNGTEVVPCNLFVLRGDPWGHYPERGASLWKFHVTDRNPVQ